MRVIAGSARRIPLKTPEGMETRPTTDRIKETLFNMIQDDLADCSFLDLFGGSGAIGIEALSRGAGHAVFVEKSRLAAACIRDNLETTGLAESADVMCCDVLTALKQMKGKNLCFDFVFMDPPYDKEWEKPVLTLLSSLGLINQRTVIIIEASLNTRLTYIDELGFLLEKEKIYKTNKHLFIRRGE